MSWLKTAVSRVGEKAEALKQSERFQRFQERTSTVMLSAAEGVKRAREKIGRPASAIEFEAQLENRAKTTRTLAAVAEMHKSWAQSIASKDGPRVTGEHELGFKEMFLQSRALEYSLEVIIAEPSLREHYVNLTSADASPAALHDLLCKSLAFPAAQWQALIQVAMSGDLPSEQLTWIVSAVTAMKIDWNEEVLCHERKELAVKAELFKQELRPLGDSDENTKKRIELSTQLLQTYQEVQQNLQSSEEHREEVRQLRQGDLQHLHLQIQARIVGLQSQAESSTKSQKDLEGELNQSQDSLRLQLEHMDEVRAQIDKEIEELDERKRQLRMELDAVSRQLDEARAKQKQHMEKSDKQRSELYSIKSSLKGKINAATSEAQSSEREKDLLDQTRKIIEEVTASLQASGKEQDMDLKQKQVDFQEHFKALLADHLRFCEAKANKLQAQAEAAAPEAKESLLAAARDAEAALEEFQKTYGSFLNSELKAQIASLREAYGRTKSILGGEVQTSRAKSAESAAESSLLEPPVPEAAGYPAASSAPAPII
ncbi:unnamed protein product [Effrenium voratum]|uniref:Uncharacterized protein n=1 Tax=Effrenium voratum TaxID=2562239 RepID=A0AA36NDS1_9DINO|nr:unnamed protein product [Effrenium voratum]CAJ1454460.1 unnamed protein product [Effrenium voratum]